MDKDKLVKCTQCNWEGIEAQAEEGCCPNCTADIIKKEDKIMEFKFEQGEVLKDKVTGFEGVVLGRTEYATRCIHYGLCSRSLNEDGEPTGWQWFDEARLIKVENVKKVMLEPQWPIWLRPSAPQM